MNMKEKIWAGKYINLSLLLKSSAELNACQGSQLIFSDEGVIETRPKVSAEKIKNIELRFDAFLIFMDIYLIQKPQACSDLLAYIANIRQATSRRNDSAWFIYDEQFRLRQECFPQAWGKLNNDLWIKIMTLPIRNRQPQVTHFSLRYVYSLTRTVANSANVVN
jgi:hypothetical protein